MNHFKGKQFQQDMIIVAVGYYLRYNLSYREVQEILYNRGINVSHNHCLSLGTGIWENYFTTIWQEEQKNNGPFIREMDDGPILKSKENGIIFYSRH